MDLREKLAPKVARHTEIANLMAAGDMSGEKFTALSKEYAELSRIVDVINAYGQALKEREDLKDMLNDPDMKDMAEEDRVRLDAEIPVLEEKIRISLIPRDVADDRNAILEIRAGTGGDEAALFAADLFGMYRGYAQSQGWKVEVMEMSENDLGGYKEIIVQVTGDGVFGKLKYESGGHRVQRVPKTETQGRIHTSAATVAVMPEAEDVDIKIEDKDLRIDVFRAGGAGGQHVNKTESAVRITHLPTGLAVAIQEEKSQHKNKARAMKILQTRLYDMQRQKLAAERAATRKSQIGSGDRSERIRTYNFPQSRMTDHRIGLTQHNLEEILSGFGLEEVIEATIKADQAEQLANLDM
ncbi:MAG: peptide chain release factor 1 [Alphaproteobacteria bacterium]|jgi:peptide chain release factor 1|nr:peptide chain release factor 1 [Alphaproteobacteria bacterium]